MSRRITKERANELFGRKQKHLNVDGGNTSSNRQEQKRLQKESDKRIWEERMRKRGGLIPRKAKYWGDDCDIKQCERWVDGSCQYPDRDNDKCVMDGEKNAD